MPLFTDSPDEAGHAGRDPGAHARREADVLLSPTRKHWNEGEGLEPYPTGQESKAGHGASTLLQATGHRPRATGHFITTHHVLRTTYPQGGKRVHPYDEMTQHEPRAATTGHEPRATCRCFVIPAKRAFGPCEPFRTGIASVARGRRNRKRRWRRANDSGEEQTTTATKQRPNLDL